MWRRLTLVVWMVVLCGPISQVFAQAKSVRPGINDTFRKPDPKEFVNRFEVESREVYARRHDIVKACQLKPGQSVADIGAGTGIFTSLFSEAVGPEGRVIAVDIAQEFLDHIEQASRQAGRRNVETVRCEADSTGLAPESIDLAFICDTYHHFEFPLKTMASLHRALKPNGRVVLIDFKRIPGESSDWVMSHVRGGEGLFSREIARVGFQPSPDKHELLKENYFAEFKKMGRTPLEFPILTTAGGVVPLPGSAEQPRAGAKVVFDVTAGPKGDVNKGLERAARLINLYGGAGLQASDVKIAIVFHGEATTSVLTAAAQESRGLSDPNPNLPLLRELRDLGVDLFVCGQAMRNHLMEPEEVDDSVTVAASALTVVMNRQAEGYSYVPVP